jgi:hypothetical protein
MKLYSLIALISFTLFSCQNKTGEYVCKPCDLPCDELVFNEPGICPHCSMDIIKKSDLTPEKELIVNEINIQSGSGAFLVEGGVGNEGKKIKIFYHKPKIFKPTSRVLIVVPGAGRNGDSYRDAWIEESEKYGLLILSPMYFEDEYGFGDYHLCGLIKNSNLKNNVTYVENTNIAKLNEEQFSFEVNSKSDEWIFNDFDRIFDSVKKSLNLTQSKYDIFGHSAGGHILHRLALFQVNSKANKILAANPSFYTLPSFEYDFPFGLKNSPIEQESLRQAFKKKLVVFLGELDNENETGGTFLRSKSADKQGIHRLERGKFFFNNAKELAEEMSYEFNWKIVIVPKVGHDQIKMGAAAGDYLYKNEQ